ncbi:MAG: hypothetical protein GYA55_06390 [SAR324 cluster bacterium]|uniref:DUF7654 domain-containing protein n=1 Tax=SAR324 cluster bacterium TaxID=2024889 RepID=A0A7X9FRB2_9DELT|nr:hypothetical protein [SAR324 cluster bacterium]
MLDPEGKYESVYNRFAHIYFVASEDAIPRFRNIAFDTVVVELNPASPLLKKLGVTHILAIKPDKTFNNPNLKHLGAVGDRHVYAVATDDKKLM